MNKNFTVLYGLIVLTILTLFLYGVSSILLPFIVGLVLSYFLAPLVDSFEKVKVPRSLASILTVALFVGFLAVLSITILPVLYTQLIHLGEGVSNHKEDIRKVASSLMSWVAQLDPHIAQKIETAVADFSGTFFSVTSHMLGSILQSSFAAITTIALIFISPIVMFYTLNNWNKIMSVNASMVPKKYRKDVFELVDKINSTLTGYIKGQTYVCLTLAAFYSVALSFAGLESAIALGVMSGLLVVIPYAGVLFSGFLCVLIAITQSGSLNYGLIILVIFIAGQVIEGNFLTPTLVGRSIGLNPIWIIFGVMAGGALMGFVGVIIALPLTAVLGVVIKFSFRKYTKSKFYNSTSR